MSITWTWELLFLLAAGASFLGAVISLAAGTVYSGKDRYIPAAIALTGLTLYSLFEGMGIIRDPELIRYSYAMLAFTASMFPWMYWKLLNEKHGTLFMVLPLFGLLFGSFAFSEAFPNARDLTFGCYEGMYIKWAFWAIDGFAGLAGLGSGIWSLNFALRPGRVEDFKKGSLLATGSLIFTVSIILQAISDCKLAAVGNGWGGAGALAMAVTISLMPILDGIRGRNALKNCHKKLEEQQTISTRDPLTGLFNRNYFFEVMNRSMERLRRDGDAFGLMLVDLDDFKLINDRFGHPAGDYCLSSVSKVIMRSCRAYDCPARYGGDEFIILITYNTDKKSLKEVASRIYEGIQNLKLPYGSAEITITATMGVMLVNDGDMRTDTILNMVDEAMYQGKRKGKGQMVTI